MKNYKILIVDDNETNLTLLAKSVKSFFNVVITENNASNAFIKAKEELPDIIVLDIMMPEINGFDICEMIKHDEATKEIPVIFVTALHSKHDLVRAFEVGGADYITKPYNLAELKARIKNQLQLLDYKKQIMEYNKKLERLNIEKNEFLGIAAHDLKNPLFSLSLIAKVLKNDDLTNDEIKEFASDILTSTNRMLEIITNILDINAIEQQKISFSPIYQSVSDLLKYVIKNNNESAVSKSIKLNIDITENLSILVDTNAFIQTCDNLISNALKFSLPNKNIFIRLFENDNMIRFEVEDEGPGISEEDMTKLFGKFTKLSARPTGGENSTGLGLSIVKLYVENMKGKIWCESELNKGAKFIVELPKETLIL